MDKQRSLKTMARQFYYSFGKSIVQHPSFITIAQEIANRCDSKDGCEDDDNYDWLNDYGPFAGPFAVSSDPAEPIVKQGFPDIMEDYIKDELDWALGELGAKATDQVELALDDSGGWAGAGTVYARLVGINGELAKATQSLLPDDPYITESRETPGDIECAGFLGSIGKKLFGMECSPSKSAIALFQTADYINKWWNDESSSGRKRKSGPDTVIQNNENAEENWTFITSFTDWFMDNMIPAGALFSLDDETDKNPLAQLAGVGAMVLDYSLVLFGGGITASVFQVHSLGNALFVFGGFIFSVGVLLNYVLPLLPYVYFLFAVFGYLVSVFEAVIGMPLFALAHLDVNAEGIVGKAKQGYITLFLLLIEPALIILAFIGSMLMFQTGILFLNETFAMTTSGYEEATTYTTDFLVNPAANMMGIHVGSLAFDWIVYPIIYAGLAYGIALASFKLIDTIPNQIIRYLGEQAQLIGADSSDALNYLDKAALGFAAGVQSVSPAVGGAFKDFQESNADKFYATQLAKSEGGGDNTPPQSQETATESPGPDDDNS